MGTREQSLGATVCRVGETLSQEYVQRQRAVHLGNYVSPDKKVDASTCAFPNNTYFIDNLNHTWPGVYAGLELDLLRRADVRVTADPAYPQFLHWDAEAENLVPLADVLKNEEEQTPGGFRGFILRVKAFFQSFFQRIRDFFTRRAG